MAIANPDLDILQGKDQAGDNTNPPQDPSLNTSLPVDNPTGNTPAEEDDINDLLLELVKYAEKEDEDLRFNLIRMCKRNDFYFNNIQRIFFDESARDFRTFDSVLDELAKFGAADDIKTINIYRAFLESLVAALSVDLPGVEFAPDDAEDPDDIETAETYSKIAEVIQDHIQAPLMLIKGLTTLFNMGVIFGYNYYKQDPNLGIISTPKPGAIREVQNEVFDLRCPQCSELLDSSVPANIVPQESQLNCPTCKYSGKPNAYKRIEQTHEVTEWEDTPKGRVGLDIFGPNYVKAPLYARDQAGLGYLILRLEDHIAKYKTVYDTHAKELTSSGGDTYSYERWGRIPPDYLGTMPKDMTTARYAWFRPWYYNVLKPEDAIKLTTKYPDGVMVTVIGEIVVDSNHEKLDDHWTVTYDPRANFIHAEPIGNAIIPIQDSKNDIFNLGLSSLEYGIPETFADPRTLNFEKYGQSKATPGMVTKAKPPEAGKSISDGFHTLKTANLSNEYTEFDHSLDSIGQFVTGAFPSVFGGNSNTGSKTAAEYAQSRSQALQRLMLSWKMISIFWSKLMTNCTNDYVANMIEDEQYSKKENGTYVNVVISKSSLTGKIGHIRPENSEQLPQSWAQKKDFFMNLLQLKDPMIGQILLHPNNSENVKQAVGMPDFYIPGENDRNKQYAEYYLMAQGQQVQPDLDVDDHPVHMQVLKNILVSPMGTNLYKNSPQLYEICIKHYQTHQQMLMAHTAGVSGNTPPNTPPQSATSTTQG